MSHFSTQAVHAGRDDLNALGVHALPLDLSTTYPVTGLEAATASFDALVAGEASAPNPIYARLHNPTVARFENALATLEGAEAAVAFGSGMATLSAVLLARKAYGQHIVAVRPIYGSADHLLSSGLLGLETTWTCADKVAEAIRADTCLVLIETPANPTLQLVDIADVVRQAGAVPVMVDSTFATPVLQTPLALGAAYVMHSATKFLGGHGDVIAGVVATSEERAKALRQVRALTGGLLHPLGGYLLHRGLATLSVRVERAQASAQLLVERLSHHPAVAAVHYPGRTLSSRAILNKQMRGPGSLLAIELAGGYAAADAVLRAVELFTPAVSLGSVDSLIQHPAGLTHRVLSEESRQSTGITPAMLRLSIGLEHPDDLWADLLQALNLANATIAA